MAVASNGNGVFDADAADVRIIKSRFDGDDVSGAQFFVHCR